MERNKKNSQRSSRELTGLMNKKKGGSCEGVSRISAAGNEIHELNLQIRGSFHNLEETGPRKSMNAVERAEEDEVEMC